MRVKILLYAEYRLPLGKGEKRLKKKISEESYIRSHRKKTNLSARDIKVQVRKKHKIKEECEIEWIWAKLCRKSLHG